MLCSLKVFSQEKLELENIQPSFETTIESQNLNDEKETNTSKLKSKIPQITSNDSVIVKFKALDKITAIHDDLLSNYEEFNTNPAKKSLVIEQSSSATGIDKIRMEHYFDNEVRNTLDEDSQKGLMKFLKEVCKISEEPTSVSLENQSE